MEEYEYEEEKGETVELYEPIHINQNEKNYILNFEIKENNFVLSLKDTEEFFSVNYTRKMKLKELIKLNNEMKSFNTYNSLYNYLKLLSDNKKINFKKYNDKITIILFGEQPFEIDLFFSKKDVDLNIIEICRELSNVKEKIKDIDNITSQNKELNNTINEMNKEINRLKIKNEELIKKIGEMSEELNTLKYQNKNEEMSNLKKDHIKALYDNKSLIMKEDEKKMIYSEIENKMNKKIKYIKKLYQATTDGGDSKIFHLKCDNIQNTLVLIKSEGKRRFGGFTPIPWKSEEIWKYKKDPEMKTFIFSLDNKKIYNLKNENVDSVFHEQNSGPCFGNGWDIGFEGNPIKDKKLYTYQSSYNYNGDKNTLSEFDFNNKGKLLECEVFEVIFE